MAVVSSATLITLDVRTRADWRRWLAKHHASSPGVWLLRHKQHTGVESMPYEDLVREALCFVSLAVIPSERSESRDLHSRRSSRRNTRPASRTEGNRALRS